GRASASGGRAPAGCACVGGGAWGLRRTGALLTETRSSPPRATGPAFEPDASETEGAARQPASARASSSVNVALKSRTGRWSRLEIRPIGQKIGLRKLCATKAAELDFACKVACLPLDNTVAG